MYWKTPLIFKILMQKCFFVLCPRFFLMTLQNLQQSSITEFYDAVLMIIIIKLSSNGSYHWCQ